MTSKILEFVAIGLLAGPVSAHAVVVYYGDQDGFGTGATTYKNATESSASAGDAAGTDVRLIGSAFVAPAFQPSSALAFAPVSGISGITITMAMAGFGGNIDPVDGPNMVVLDGLGLPAGFLDSFASFGDLADPNVQTVSFALPSSFFALFSDGSVSLSGTRISERRGFGSFQIDYISFDIAVPEPGTLALLGLGLAGLGLTRRRIAT